jgi:hypothetical protein
VAAIDDLNFAQLRAQTQVQQSLPALDILRKLVSAEFWRWYNAHSDQQLTKVKVWIFSKTVRVKDIRPLFELLFGEENQVTL